MKKIMRNSLGLGFLVSLMITACATTILTSDWKDPAYQKQPEKIMVIGVAKKSINKRIFEDEFVRQLKIRGTDAIASYRVMSDKKQNDHTVIATKMKEHGADALLISRLVSKKTVHTYMPAKVYHPPEKYGSWRDYYGYGSDEVLIPGYMAEDEYALMESNLYNAGSDKIIWSATSETEMLGTDLEQIKSYIGIMVKALEDQKLLGGSSHLD